VPIAQLVSGRYSALFAARGGALQDLGIMDDPGYRLSITPSLELVTNTDAYADSVIDAIFRGINCVLDFTCLEWKAGPLRALNQFSAQAFNPVGNNQFQIGIHAQLATNSQGAIIFSSTTGTPSEFAPATITFPQVCFHEGFDFGWMLNSRLRKLPMRFRNFPYVFNVTQKAISVTAGGGSLGQGGQFFTFTGQVFEYTLALFATT
jgi:hypothetical protein